MAKNNPNTTRKELTRLRHVFRQAIDEGEVEPAAEPFLTYKKPKAKPFHRRKLSLEEVERLRDAELDPASPTGLARDGFVWAFYVGGMRFGDVCTLRADAVREGPTGWRAMYEMMKTSTSVASRRDAPPRLGLDAPVHHERVAITDPLVPHRLPLSVSEEHGRRSGPEEVAEVELTLGAVVGQGGVTDGGGRGEEREPRAGQEVDRRPHAEQWRRDRDPWDRTS